MRPSMKSTFVDLLLMQNNSMEADFHSPQQKYRVEKENLVILDPDIMTDYPPMEQISVYLPEWIKVYI